MTKKIKNASGQHLQAHLDQLAAALPVLQEKQEPVRQLWLNIIRAAKQLSKNINRQELLLETVAAISKATGTITEVDNLLQVSVGLIQERFHFDYVGIFLIDEAGQWARLRAGEPDLAKKQKNSDVKIGGESSISQAIQRQQPQFIYEESEEQLCREMVLPLASRGRTVGALLLQNTTSAPFPLYEADAPLMQTLADQLASAIENTRLFNQAEDNRRFLKTIIEHIPDPIFIKDKNHVIIEMNQANARVIGKPEHELIGKTDYDFFPKELADKFYQRNNGVFSANEVYVTEDQTIWADGQEHTAYTRLIPITDSGGQPEYLLGITHDVTERKAQEAEREQLLAETAALYKGSQAIASAMSEGEIFEAVIEQIRRQEPCEISIFQFHRVNNEPVWVELQANWQKRNKPSYPTGTRFYSSESPQVKLLATKEPMFIEDIATDPRLSAAERQSFAPTAACSVAILPLVATEERLGAVLVYFTQPYTFTQTTQRLWLSLVDQVGIGLANRQLIQKASHHLVQMETAAEVAQAATSILDLEELLNTTVELIRDRFDLYYVGVFLVDQAKEWAVLRAGTGEAGRRQLKKGHRLKIGGESMIGWSIHNRQPRIALDVGKDAVHFQNPDLPDTHSEMALPLIHRQDVIGALTIQSVERAAFSQEDITFLQIMANQLANAIQNAQLFEQAQQEIIERKLIEKEIIHRNEELAAINRVATAVVSTLDLEAMLQAIAREMVQIFNANRSGIGLLNTGRTELTIVADYAAQENDELAIGAVIPVANNPSSIQVIETGHPIVVSQAQTNPLTAPIHEPLRQRGTQCLMIVPLLSRGKVIGTIGIDTAEVDREFTPAEVTLAETIAGQIANAIENARLFEETQANLIERQRVEKALRASEAKYRQLVQTANSIILRMDPKGQITFINEFAQRFFGYTEAEIIGRNVLGTIVPETDLMGRNLTLMIEDILQQPDQYANNENENLCKNGERVWVAWTNKGIRDDQGNITEILCIGNDITQRKKAEEALRTSEALYVSLVESLPQNIFRKDLEGRFIFANQHFCATEGKPLAEIIGKTDFDLYPAELAKKYRQDDRRVIESGEIFETVEEHRAAGEPATTYVRVVKIPTYDSKGQVNGIQAIFWDITERKQAEEELRFQKTLLESQGEASPNGILVISNQRTILFYNRRFSEMWDLPERILASQSADAALQRIRAKVADPEAFLERVNYLDEHKDEESYDELILKDGRTIDRYSAPVKSPDGIHYGRVWHFRDITERKRAEEALRKSEEQYRSIYNHTPALLHSIDQEGRLVSVSDYWLEALGYERSEVIGRRHTEFLTEESRRYAEEVVLPEFYQTGISRNIPYQFLKKNGEIMDVLLSGAAKWGQNGELEYSLTVLVDVTKLRQAEKALQASLRRTQLLYNISEALATLTDRQVAFETVLGEYLALLNLKRGGLMLFDSASGYNKVAALYVDGKAVKTELAFPAAEDYVAQHLIAYPFPLVLENPGSHELTKHNQHIRGQVESMLLIPLVARGGVVGILGADATEKGHTFTQEEIEIGEAIADQLVVWLENSQLLEETRHRSNLLQTAAEVSKAASSILDVDELINASVNLIRDQFDFYYVGLFLVDEARKWAVLRAGTGEAGRIQLENGHRLEIGGESMIGWCIQNHQARIALDVGEDAVHFQNPALPDTHSEMALPLISRDEVIGALTVQSVERGAFSGEDITVLQTMADQLANAITTARLFENVTQAQKTAEALLQETQALHQLSQALAGTLQVSDILNLFCQACIHDIGFEYVQLSLVDKYQHRVKAIAGVGVSENQLKHANHSLDSNDIMADIIRTGRTEIITGWDDRFDRQLFEAEGHAEWIRVFTPIALRQENIGLVEAGFNKTTTISVEDSHLRLLRAFIDQTALALDNAQRYEASQRAARREALIKDIIAKVRASTDLDTILQTTVKEIGDAIDGTRSYVHLVSPANGDTNNEQR